MKTAKSHIFKVFKGVVAVTFLTALKNQNHFNGWIFFDWKINLMLAQSKIQRKNSRKLCYMEFIKIEINGFERQPLFEIKKSYVKKQWNRNQVRLVMEKFKKEVKCAKNYKYWTLNCRNSKVVWNILILFCVIISHFHLVFAFQLYIVSLIFSFWSLFYERIVLIYIADFEFCSIW